MALGQETLTHSRRPRLQNSSSGHSKPLIATRVARFLPVLDKSDAISFRGGGDGRQAAEALRAPQSIVVRKKERFVANERTAGACTKLAADQLRFLVAVKEIARVQVPIAEVLVGEAVQVV